MAGVTATDSRRPAEHVTLLEAAAAEMQLSEAGYGEQRKKEVEDLKFEAGEHFTEAELSWLKSNKQPDMVMDQTSGQVAKVTNAPVHRIVVIPNGGGADPKTAEYWQGICRRIENLSHAETVYKWARRHATVMGRGFWRVRADYFADMEMLPAGMYPVSVLPNQDIRIEPILHQHSVHPDPRCTQLDYSDQRFCIITSDIEWSEFQRLFPKAKFSTAKELRGVFASTADCPPEWATEKAGRVAERYWIEDQELKLCVLKAGTVLQDGDTPLATPTVIVKGKDTPEYPKEAVLREHTFKIPKVKWMKYTAAEILDGPSDVPGRFIPVVRINGERRIIEGKEDNRGMVRMAKWPQRMVDFYEQRLAKAVDNSAYPTWKVAQEAVEQYAKDYDDFHRTRPARLTFNHRDSQGEAIPAPELVKIDPDIGAIVVAAQRAGMNLRHTLGVPDVTPEESKPEQSGKAIGLRQREQAQATSHYSDSTALGIQHTARIIVSMAREIYDVPQILRINGKDEKEIEVVTYRGEDQQAQAETMARDGLAPQAQMRHMLRIDAGQFDFTIAPGKGHDTARQETVDVLDRVLPLLPPPMAVKAVPILLKNIDAPGMLELAQQLAPPEESGMVPVGELNRIKQQAGEIIEQAKQKIAQLEDEIRSKRDELGAKMQIEQYKADRQAETDRYKADADVEKARIAAMGQAMRPQPVASPEFA